MAVFLANGPHANGHQIALAGGDYFRFKKGMEHVARHHFDLAHADGVQVPQAQVVVGAELGEVARIADGEVLEGLYLALEGPRRGAGAPAGHESLQRPNRWRKFDGV